jgi:hypothetical protein
MHELSGVLEKPYTVFMWRQNLPDCSFMPCFVVFVGAWPLFIVFEKVFQFFPDLVRQAHGIVMEAFHAVKFFHCLADYPELFFVISAEAAHHQMKPDTHSDPQRHIFIHGTGNQL